MKSVMTSFGSCEGSVSKKGRARYKFKPSIPHTRAVPKGKMLACVVDPVYTLSLELKTALEVCVSVDSPRSLAVWMLLKKNDPEAILQYLSLTRPDGHWSFGKGLSIMEVRELALKSYAYDYLVTEILSKNPGLNSGIDRKAAAMSKFLEAETLCKDTNRRLLSFRLDLSHPMHPLIKGMRRVIRTVLGKLTTRKLDMVLHESGFGPGATSVVSGADVLLSKKYAGDLHVTPRLRPYARSLMGVSWLSIPEGQIIVNDESRTTSVPKNAKTERVIAIEPSLNGYVQKGIGQLLRSRLKMFGVNLDTQEWNRFLASQAQAWQLSTIDLSMASDTVARRLVWLLFEKEWATLLEIARVDFTTMGGARVELEKFSSMGNGFTFELETLIFYAAAIASGANPKLLAVYGDDIIVEREVASTLIPLLNFVGFKTNEKKTFLEGNFFESCGSDWFDGKDVRPFYLKGDYVDDTQCRLYIPNALRRYAHRLSGGLACDARFKKAWVSARRRLTFIENCTAIPDHHGDAGLVLNWDESAPSRGYSNEVQNWCGLALPLKSIRAGNTSFNGAYLAALHKGASEMIKSEEFTRGKISRYEQLQHAPVLNWCNLGPWL